METPYSTKSFLLAGFFAIIILGAVNIYLVKSFGFSFETSLKDTMIGLPLWILGAFIIGNTLKYYFPRQSRFIFLGGLTIGNTLIWITLINIILPLWLGKVHGYKTFFDQSIPVRSAFCFLLYTALSMLFAFLYTLREQHLAEQRKSEALQLARKTELNNLQEKLQPHFLFNSLNSINALVVMQPDRARQMVQQLSDFLRGTLKRESQELITLEKELEYLSLYLDIEKVRFGHRLKTQIDEGNGTATFLLPPFILLPIMENAIKFGLYDTLDKIEIHLSTKIISGMLEVNVSNPFDPSTSGQIKGTGFGLKSVGRRLYLLFGRSDLLKTNTNGDIFTTTVLIPQSI